MILKFGTNLVNSDHVRRFEWRNADAEGKKKILVAHYTNGAYDMVACVDEKQADSLNDYICGMVNGKRK